VAPIILFQPGLKELLSTHDRCVCLCVCVNSLCIRLLVVKMFTVCCACDSQIAVYYVCP